MRASSTEPKMTVPRQFCRDQWELDHRWNNIQLVTFWQVVRWSYIGRRPRMAGAIDTELSEEFEKLIHMIHGGSCPRPMGIAHLVVYGEGQTGYRLKAEEKGFNAM